MIRRLSDLIPNVEGRKVSLLDDIELSEYTQYSLQHIRYNLSHLAVCNSDNLKDFFWAGLFISGPAESRIDEGRINNRLYFSREVARELKKRSQMFAKKHHAKLNCGKKR